MQIAGLCNFVEVSFVFGGLFVCGCELLPSKFDVRKPLYSLWGVFRTRRRNNL